MGKKTGERARWQEEFVPLAILLLLAAWFFFSFFHKFAGLRSGDGEFGGGMAFLAGRRPYRDYFTAGPPLNQLKAALELGLFGKALIVSRTAGVMERLFIAGLLYFWLRRSFSAGAAMLASFVTIVVSAGDHTDPIASYNHDAIFFAMICGYAVTLSLDAERWRKSMLLAAVAGIGAGLAFLTKQTVGGAALVSMLVFGLIAIAKVRGGKRAAAWAVTYLAGAALPVGIVGLYLWRTGVLRACLTMLFVSGPAAKASHPFLFLSRELMIAGDNWIWLLLGCLGILFSCRAVWRSTVGKAGTGIEKSPRWIAAMVLGCAVVVAVAEALSYTSLPAMVDFGKSSVYYAFVGCGILGIFALIVGIGGRGGSGRRALPIAIFAALAWSVAASLSLSWPAFEPMVLPGLGLLLAAAVDGTTSRWGQGFLYLVMSAMVFLQMREKLDTPFTFDHQDEPAVRFALATSDQPELRGMRLPPETVRLLDDTVRSVQEHAKPGDTIFTFPEMGLLYSLTGRQAPTFTDSHNLDVVQDSFARSEAVLLAKSRPVVLVYARPSETNMEQDERLWRESRPSGQRDIVAVMDGMLRDYELVGTYRLAPEDNPINLYVRSR